MLAPDDLERKIALTLIPGLGDKLLKLVIAHFESVDAIFESSDDVLKLIPRVGLLLVRNRHNKDIRLRAKMEADFVRKHRICHSFILDDDFPYRLKECSDGPVLIFWKGNIDLNCGRIISIVGTRKVTPYGDFVTKKLVEDLKKTDPKILIVSGMAYGVDIIAHRAAVSNDMATAGVLAHGLDRLYPGLHSSTAKQMLNNGGLLTEFLSGTNPDPQNFVKRNRIVAGLSDATIIVESSVKGGALITANIALSYNRDVLAFPGMANAEFSAGCNWLIKTNQAALIEGANDLMKQLNWESKKKKKGAIQKSLFVELSDDERLIFDLLRQEREMALNFISLKLNQPVSKTSVLLFNMEMNGLVQVLPGNVYRLL